jgi:IclR family transcriptional regulator, KDG regulon repressor
MIQVINRAMDILELIAKNPEQVRSLTEIADSMHLNHATCANIIKTLVNRKYIEQVGHKKGYRLGQMSYALTNNFSYKRDLVQAAKEAMEVLTRKINENSLLAIIKDNKRILLYDVPSDQDLQVRTSLEKNVYEAATGRLLLAYLPGKERDSFIGKYGLPAANIWPEADSREDLYAQLDKIQQEGIAVQLTNKHIIGIAVPVKKAGQVVASLGIFLPEFRFTGTWKKEIVSSLKSTAEQISKKLAEQ